VSKKSKPSDLDELRQLGQAEGRKHLLAWCCGVCTVPSGYPRILESPTLKAVEKDRNTVMLCSATGDPEPTINWLKDYVPVDLSDTRFKVLATGKFCPSLKLPVDRGEITGGGRMGRNRG